jgi:hypothetical protein
MLGDDEGRCALYHIGIRHYTATDPYQLAICRGGPKITNAALNAAMSAR